MMPSPLCLIYYKSEFSSIDHSYLVRTVPKSALGRWGLGFITGDIVVITRTCPSSTFPLPSEGFATNTNSYNALFTGNNFSWDSVVALFAVQLQTVCQISQWCQTITNPTRCDFFVL